MLALRALGRNVATPITQSAVITWTLVLCAQCLVMYLVLSDWSMARQCSKEEWRCAKEESGAQSVMTLGVLKRPLQSVDSLVSQD